MAKQAKKGLKKQKVSVSGRVISVAYPTLGKSLSLDCDRLNDEMQDFLMIHGGKQILGDSASGKPAVEKYEMAQRRIEALLAGDEKLTAQPDTISIVAEAVSRIKGLTKEVVLTSVSIKPEIVKEWRENKQVKHMIRVIYEERAKAELEAEEDSEEIEVPGL